MIRDQKMMVISAAGLARSMDLLKMMVIRLSFMKKTVSHVSSLISCARLCLKRDLSQKLSMLRRVVQVFDYLYILYYIHVRNH